MKKLISFIVWFNLLRGIALAGEALVYECTPTGEMIGTELVSEYVFRGYKDTDGDGKEDVKETFFYDRGCLRKIRIQRAPFTETLFESYLKDMEAVEEYLKSVRDL